MELIQETSFGAIGFDIIKETFAYDVGRSYIVFLVKQ